MSETPSKSELRHTKQVGTLLITSALLWLSTTIMNISPSSISVKPLTISSEIAVEWFGISLLFAVAGFLSFRGKVVSASATSVTTTVLSILIVLGQWAPPIADFRMRIPVNPNTRSGVSEHRREVSEIAERSTLS